jgi:hydrophobe/amphiphile efflux-1 (HAE1) family protein
VSFNISAWAIRHPLPSIVLAIILLVLGWLSFVRLPVTQMPVTDFPMVSVVVSQSGAVPSELEGQVTRFIEDSVSGIEGVHHIGSQITDGVSVTTIEFRLDTNSDRALNDVKDAVTRARPNLPRNIDGEPLVQRLDVVDLPIVTYAAISPGKTPERLSWFVDDVVQRSLRGVRGVAQVERIGGVDREILVSLDPDRLQAVGLTSADVSRMIRGNNVDVAGGRAEIGGRIQAIRTLAGAKTISQLSSMMIGLPMGGEVRLEDLGVVTDTVAAPKTFARYNGDPVVAFGVWRSKGQSDVVVAAAVQKEIDKIKQLYPDVDLKPIDNSVDFTLGNYEAAIHTLFEGAALAVIVVFLFLRDIRATIIAAVSLPLSIFPAFWALDILGFSLNLVSFLAITLSTGILVDDAIVEIENIVRHMRMGKSPYQAAIDAADEIGLAVIAISLTIVAIFTPASFMPGIAGQFFKQFGITVSVQVLFSLLAARLITPMLAAYFLRHHTIQEKPPGPVLRVYTRVVTWSVRHYLVTVLAGLMVFGASIWSLGLLPKGFLPAQDRARSQLAIELPPGSRLSDTENVTEDIVKRLRARPEVMSVFVDGGRVPKGAKEIRLASLFINYTPKAGRSVSQHDLEFDIGRELDGIPDIRYWFLDGPVRPITLDVTGTDSAAVGNVAEELASEMRRIPLVANVIADTALERPELRIHPRQDVLARLGVSTEGLSETIRIATMGDVGPALARFDAGERLVPIRVQLEQSARGNLQVIERLRVPMARGGGVPLGTIAEISLNQGPTKIDRWDRNRRATVSADLVGKSSLDDAMNVIFEVPSVKSRPKGVEVSKSGDAENMAELADGFAAAMTFGLIMVYAVLVLLFGSFLQPITILFSLPLSIGGAIIALLIGGMQLTVSVSIGILMLMGIVTKNAIMLVDFAIEFMHAGMKHDAAIIDAGLKRARPIIMTTIAMIAGMIPSALAFGAGGEFRAPMAVAVIGGLLFSTALSLIFVPAVFILTDNMSQLSARLGSRFFGKSSEGEHAAMAGHSDGH